MSPVKEAEDLSLIELMRAYQGGDLSAFEQLYAALVDDVRRYFSNATRNRAMAEDLVQDTFLEIHRARRTYNPPLPVRPWVFGIARNVLARSRRGAWMREKTISSSIENEPVAPATISHSLPADALDIENALSGLPASTRDPWLLHHVLGLSFDAIARRLGITVMAAKLRSSRATRALRAALALKPKKGLR